MPNAAIRIATFNVENLFARARIMNLKSWQDGKEVLAIYARLNTLFQKSAYSAGDKLAILEGLKKIGLGKNDDNQNVRLRQNRGKLVRRPKGKPAEIVANGRGDWLGWLELVTEAVNDVATQNTARVIKEMRPDILGVVEAEDRISLKHFNEDVISAVGGASFDHVMLIDGNDERGIDLGLMTRKGFEIVSMVSHVDDEVGGKLVFSRDCPEYEVKLPSGATLLVLANHLKSKGYGSQSDSDAKRGLQAKKIREIYDARRAAGAKHLVVMGDFNDYPEHGPLDSLLKNGSDLKDVSLHPAFQSDGRPGTYGNGTASGKFDYVLLSPDLFAKVKSAGVFRKGVWGGKNGTLWPHFPEITKEVEAASDHAAVWAEIEV